MENRHRARVVSFPIEKKEQENKKEEEKQKMEAKWKSDLYKHIVASVLHRGDLHRGERPR